MAKKSKKAPTKAVRTGGRPRKSGSPSSRTAPVTKPSAAAPVTTAAAERFVSGLLIRGEAATRDKKGKVPLQATHRIKKQKRDGSVEVERVRFKMF